ncbi:hypothetical protein INS49_009109 [Diaporthe citri]|uniref:uncharacterized protein n=1 Tax=Diaporthe citri TaxID=83186 RepID=UPI001C7EF149|nr:uncharacterized protein INS49_009109 [Diaporthe citri]KAG6364006.1 hypothetical protein INS49_009109 [Diaporthe citri]
MAPTQHDLPPHAATGKDDAPVVVVTVLMTLIATIFIGLRLYGCLLILRRRLYLEEWLSVINQIDLWLTAALVIKLYTKTAAGRRWATLSDSERTKAVFWHNVLTAPSVLGLGLPKLTVVSLLTRVFKPGQLHQTILWVSAILCVVNFVVVILLAWLPCRPISAAWDVSITAKRCLDPWIYVKFCYYATTFSAALDLYFALYPAFVFRKLGWNIRKKLVLSGVMGLGICATAVAVYKITTLKVLAFTDDFTYDVSTAIIPTVVEANTIMIAACMSTLHPVYELVCQKFRRQTPGEDGVGPAHRHGNADESPSGAKRGFWSMLLERDLWTESTIVTRLSQSRSQRRTVHASEHDETTAIPIRTLEDAQNTQAADEGLARESRGDKALTKLYHAGLVPYSGRS